MFTGIVEGVGRVVSLQRESAGARLRIDANCLEGGVALGDSVAIDGVCLTVESFESGILDFRATAETLEKTTLGRAAVGGDVNLERALAYGDRVGGHLVTGHVDGIGRVTRVHEAVNDWRISFEVPDALRWTLIQKGSIAVDGISLTIVDPAERGFTVAVVRFTLEHTTLGRRSPGDPVHIEGDVMGRWVAHLLELSGRTVHESRPLDRDRIHELGGFGADG